MTLVFGTDPEFFAKYEKDGKDFVLPPAWFRKYGKIPYAPGKRGHHIFLDAMEEFGVTVIEDGVAFEETVRPSTNWKELIERVNKGRELLSRFILSQFPNECSPDVATIPTINYDVQRWRKEGKEDPDFEMCFIFGCDQDYDADNSNAAGKVVDALKHKFRYGGGHIHVSGSESIKKEPLLAVQSLKLTAGLAAVAFSDTPELDRNRTYLYGKPAKYRQQEYSGLFEGIPFTDFGIEYRTPSNRWTSSFEHAEQLFKWAEIGIKNLLEGGLVLDLLDKINMEVRDAIINCNQAKAKELLSYIETRI